MMQTIFPLLRYRDARRAIRWLCDAFGFVEQLAVPQAGEIVRHAQLRFGSNVVMLGSVRPDDGITSPSEIGISTQALCVYVDNVDTHFSRARSAGAEIIDPPEDTEYGSREYRARDLEGHIWTFGTYRPEGTGNGSATLSPQLPLRTNS